MEATLKGCGKLNLFLFPFVLPFYISLAHRGASSSLLSEILRLFVQEASAIGPN